jgi:hypothetical protein
MIRQGDVLLVGINSIPTDATSVSRENGRVVLAHGEATGHAHAISSDSCALLEHAGLRYLDVGQEVTLEHEDHGHISVPKGKYRVTRQAQYTPEAFRNVAD